MPPTLYLHIGMNKTGTTAIQQYLRRHRADLQRAGILYPVAGTHREEAFAHHKLAKAAGFQRTPDGDWQPNAKALKAIRNELDAEIAAQRPRTVLMSSETFVRDGPPAALRDVTGDMPVKIVVYLRRHDAWMESRYCQNLKMTRPKNNDRETGAAAFLRTALRGKNSGNGNYRRLVDRWAAVFGRENIIVRPYEKQQNQPGLIADFLRATGCLATVEKAGIETDAPRRNESMPLRAIQLLEAFRTLDVPEDTYAALKQHVLTAPHLRDGERQPLTPPRLRRRLVEHMADDYAWIARTYLGREDGRLFLDPLPDPDEPWTEPAPLPPTVVVEETLMALSAHQPSAAGTPAGKHHAG